jgi:hypothetical protein
MPPHIDPSRGIYGLVQSPRQQQRRVKKEGGATAPRTEDLKRGAPKVFCLMSVPSIPAELIALPQWVIWRYETRQGKETKAPYTTMGYRASVTNPEHWSTFEFASRAAARPKFADGVGFVFSAEDPFCGIDLDDVWQSDADENTPRWAQEIFERFADTYLEESPSGDGVKIWCRARLSHSGRCWPVEHGAIEIYDHSRFFTVTGRSNGVRVITDHQSDVDSLIRYLAARASAPSRAGSALPSANSGASAALIGSVIPYGTQHNTLVSLAGSMWNRGFSVDEIDAALQIANAKRCEKPGPPQNIRKIAESISRYPR